MTERTINGDLKRRRREEVISAHDLALSATTLPAGQRAQAAAPALDDQPPGHRAHPLLAAAFEYHPAGQSSQASAPP